MNKCDELIANVRGTFESGLSIIERKNRDYSGGDDLFRNLRSSAGVLGIPVERAILVRVLDKISRINTLLDQDPAVVEESLADSVVDAINYLGLLKAFQDIDKKESGQE